MSSLRRTIEAFPRGRTTEELFVLMDCSADADRRASVLAELEDLQAQHIVRQDRRGRWTALQYLQNSAAQSSQKPARDHDQHADGMVAIPAKITRVPRFVETKEAQSGTVTAHDILRYWHGALRADQRGSTAERPDRHRISWALLSGSGTILPEDDTQITISIEQRHLPEALGQAFLKQEGAAQSVAIGWPLEILWHKGAQAVVPVGIMSASWSREGEGLTLTIENSDLLLNPAWLKLRARSADMLADEDGNAYPIEEFLDRVKWVCKDDLRDELSGANLRAQLDPSRAGIFDAVAVFLSAEQRFTAGAVRDLDRIQGWDERTLSETALALPLGLDGAAHGNAAQPINIGSLNPEQIEAVRNACSVPWSVITGPPGTGKSQTILSIAASVVMRGGSVLVASKNHQALDAIEDRLGSLAPDIPLPVRTLDRGGNINKGVEDVLKDILSSPDAPRRRIDEQKRTRLEELIKERDEALSINEQRAKLECEIAELLYRLEIHGAGAHDNSAANRPEKSGFWSQLLALFGLARTDAARITAEGGVRDVRAMKSQLEGLRTERDALPEIENPVLLTRRIDEVASELLPALLSQIVSPDQDQRQELIEQQSDFKLSGAKRLPDELARSVIKFRPLWLASILGLPNRVPLCPGLFDVVIFDEASQCDIAAAVPLLARAKRAVVVGDDQQLSYIPPLGLSQDRTLMKALGLPPKKFGAMAQSQNSLFDFASKMRGAERVFLARQYRSHEDIVDYLNQEFYRNKLIVSYDQRRQLVPITGKAGLHWTDVPAPLAKAGQNRNLAEARAIAEHVAYLLHEKGYDGTIGVITPFRTQVEVLAAEINKRVSPPAREQASLVVRTVDSMQGEERDVILFSPCVTARSPASQSTFLKKNPRRLNVAISRARVVAHIFGDLSFARSGKVPHLARLAARATEPRRKRDANGMFDSDWERRVYEALKARGLKPEPQYEIAGRRLDFALFGSNGVKVDLEVDGRNFHEDIHGNRKLDDLWRDAMLEGLGWTVIRFWVDQLQKDMEGCLDRVEQKLGR